MPGSAQAHHRIGVGRTYAVPMNTASQRAAQTGDIEDFLDGYRYAVEESGGCCGRDKPTRVCDKAFDRRTIHECTDSRLKDIDAVQRLTDRPLWPLGDASQLPP